MDRNRGIPLLDQGQSLRDHSHLLQPKAQEEAAAGPPAPPPPSHWVFFPRATQEHTRHQTRCIARGPVRRLLHQVRLNRRRPRRLLLEAAGEHAHTQRLYREAGRAEVQVPARHGRPVRPQRASRLPGPDGLPRGDAPLRGRGLSPAAQSSPWRWGHEHIVLAERPFDSSVRV
jgi:hypothetical protein